MSTLENIKAELQRQADDPSQWFSFSADGTIVDVDGSIDLVALANAIDGSGDMAGFYSAQPLHFARDELDDAIGDDGQFGATTNDHGAWKKIAGKWQRIGKYHHIAADLKVIVEGPDGVQFPPLSAEFVDGVMLVRVG